MLTLNESIRGQALRGLVHIEQWRAMFPKPLTMTNDFTIAGVTYRSRLLIGPAEASGAEIVTVGIRRIDMHDASGEGVLNLLDRSRYTILPNTAGCFKDTQRSDLGEGDVDFPACRDAIAKIGYEGWLIFETPAGDDPIASKKKNLAFAKAMFG